MQLISYPEQMKKLVNAYDAYTKLLTDELSELIPIATIHGWKSTRYEEGLRLRTEISDIKKNILGKSDIPVDRSDAISNFIQNFFSSQRSSTPKEQKALNEALKDSLKDKPDVDVEL